MPLAIDITQDSKRWAAYPALLPAIKKAVRAAATYVAFPPANSKAEVSVLLTTNKKIQILNRDYRGKDKPTDVLSFPQLEMLSAGGAPVHLGDIVLAFETVAAAATAQSKTLRNHVMHLIIHGYLHLLGYDHETPKDAKKMQAAEIKILATLGIGNPYD